MFSGGPSGADMGTAMVSGKLGQASIDEWTAGKTEDVVDAFEEVRRKILSPVEDEKST